MTLQEAGKRWFGTDYTKEQFEYQLRWLYRWLAYAEAGYLIEPYISLEQTSQDWAADCKIHIRTLKDAYPQYEAREYLFDIEDKEAEEELIAKYKSLGLYKGKD